MGQDYHEHGEKCAPGDGQDVPGGVQHQVEQDRARSHGYQDQGQDQSQSKKGSTQQLEGE